MHVCHLTQSVSTHGGGISEAIRALATAQSIGGTFVSVLSPRDDGGELKPWPAESIGWLRAQRLPGLLRFPDLHDHLDERNPDLTHIHGLWTWLSVGVPRWAARHRRPTMVSPHGMLDPWALARSRWKKRAAAMAFENRHLASAACIHALCQSEADSIRAYGLKNPIAVIPNGMDLPEIGDRRSEIGDQRKFLLFLGRLHPKKGLINALIAWANFQTKNQAPSTKADWTFAIAGWDQDGHEADLKRLCHELGLSYADIPASEFVGPLCGVPGPSSLVELAVEQSSSQAQPQQQLMSPSEAPSHDQPRTKDQGPRTAPQAQSPSLLSPGSNSSVLFLGPAFGETKDALLRSASAFILPSFSEGLPMSILEAWAYRLPVLMTDHCNLPEGFDADAAIRIGSGIRSQESGGRGQGALGAQCRSRRDCECCLR